jgi:hypothetical protein
MNTNTSSTTVTPTRAPQKTRVPKPSSQTRNSTDSKDALTEKLKARLNNAASSAEFDLKAATDDVLKDIGLTSADSGGELSFYGSDPILPSSIRFGTMAAIGLAARSVALSALWKQTTGEGQEYFGGRAQGAAAFRRIL